MVSCDKDEDDGPDYSKFNTLFSTVKTFVDKLDSSSTYSYPINGSAKKTTSDYMFEVKPVGRLIAVTPKSSMTKSELTVVKEANVMKDIYLNNANGITIDCRR